MSQPDSSSDGTQTPKPTDTRLTPEDVKRIETAIAKLSPPSTTNATPTTPAPVPPVQPVQPVPPPQPKDDFKKKYEELEKIYREGVLKDLPDDLKDRFKEAGFEVLQVIAELIPRLSKKKGGKALQRDNQTPPEDGKESGDIGGFDTKSEKWKTNRD